MFAKIENRKINYKNVKDGKIMIIGTKYLHYDSIGVLMQWTDWVWVRVLTCAGTETLHETIPDIKVTRRCVSS